MHDIKHKDVKKINDNKKVLHVAFLLEMIHQKSMKKWTLTAIFPENDMEEPHEETEEINIDDKRKEHF